MKLEIRAVSKRYGRTEALRDVNLRVPGGVQVVAFVGPSGGGKSTLLRILGGLEAPDAGEICVGGERLGTDARSLQAHRRGNGYLFQAFNLFPHLSLLRNITLPLEKVHGWEAGEAECRAAECLDRLELAAMGEKMPAQLSGGQQQRGALARALAARPRLLILDEPTSALDPEMTAEVLAVIEELCREGQEIVMSTHEMGFARAVADHVVFLAEGRCVEEGAELLRAPKEEGVRRFMSRVMRY